MASQDPLAGVEASDKYHLRRLIPDGDKNACEGRGKHFHSC
jgi:hypothetical protein